MSLIVNVSPLTSARSRATSRDDRSTALETKLRQRFAAEWRRSIPVALVNRAVDEAASVARRTDFPDLFFPELAQEQIRRVATALGDDQRFFAAA